MKKIKNIFLYLEPLWLGRDNKISIRQTSAIALIIDFISNLHHAVYRWDVGKSFEGLSLILGIEAGLVVSLLGISAIQSFSQEKLEATTPIQPSTVTEIHTSAGGKVTTTEVLPT